MIVSNQLSISLCVCVYMWKLVQQSQLTLSLIAKLSKFGVKYVPPLNESSWHRGLMLQVWMIAFYQSKNK